MKNIFLIIASLLLIGCSTADFRYKVRTPTDLIPMQTDSSFTPLFYVGSDSEFHYFQHLRFSHYKKYKVPKNELNLSKTIEFGGSEKGYVMWPGTIEKALGIKL